MLHPTYPDSASRSKKITKAEAFARLCTSWNAALGVIHPAITPDTPLPLRPYGTTITKDDLTPIPARDLPPGLPDWMFALETWAMRTGDTKQLQRATIAVKVPTRARTWPPIPDDDPEV